MRFRVFRYRRSVLRFADGADSLVSPFTCDFRICVDLTSRSEVNCALFNSATSYLNRLDRIKSDSIRESAIQSIDPDSFGQVNLSRIRNWICADKYVQYFPIEALARESFKCQIGW